MSLNISHLKLSSINPFQKQCQKYNAKIGKASIENDLTIFMYLVATQNKNKSSFRGQVGRWGGARVNSTSGTI
jgi:hypothetical protein